jgi:hypothetical protein
MFLTASANKDVYWSYFMGFEVRGFKVDAACIELDGNAIVWAFEKGVPMPLGVVPLIAISSSKRKGRQRKRFR